MKLYLMRHGQASSPQVDPQQGLTNEGRAEIEKLAKRLLGLDIQFKQVFHSDKARAQQTAQIMANHLAPNVIPQMHSGLKPNDDPQRLLSEIESWQKDTLITSHLPFVPGLLAELTGEAGFQSQGMGFAPGTVVCLSRQNNNWLVEWIESP
ncbi:MAG: phosphohistidine phosphatase SixA [Gammaproteobacteria bacterium]